MCLIGVEARQKIGQQWNTESVFELRLVGHDSIRGREGSSPREALIDR